jgi:hypothetical protein
MSYKSGVRRFTVKAFVLGTDGSDSIDLSKNVKSVSVKKAFIENCLPLYVIDLRIEKAIRDRIRDSKSEISLSVSEYVLDDTTEMNETSPTSGYSDDIVVSTVLVPYDKPLATNAQSTDSDDDSDSDETSSKTANIRVDYELNCIPKDLLEINSGVVNQIYEDATMNDVVANILSDAVPSDMSVRIQPSDMKDRIDSLIIPPMNVVPAIRFLQSTYAIYENDLAVFFDTGKAYVYDPVDSSRFLSKKTLELITKKTSDTSDDSIYSNLQTDSDTGDMRLYMKNDVAIGSVKDVFMDGVGQTTVISSYDERLNGIRRQYDNDSTNGKTRYVWNEMQDPIFEKSILRTSTAGATIAISGADPNSFGPETYVLMSASIDAISGYYAISEEDYTISTSDYSTYSISIVLTLSKLP